MQQFATLVCMRLIIWKDVFTYENDVSPIDGPSCINIKIQSGAPMQRKLLSFISAISLDYKFHIPLLSMAGLILLCKNDARICFLLVQQDNAVV